jgi:glycosyltransferase involved in cell wall biosynthesis
MKIQAMITAQYDKFPKNKMMRVLILCTSQFGYHVDTYYYCKYGREMFEITYLGFEGTRPMIFMSGVKIRHVSHKGNLLYKWLRWLWGALIESRKKYDIVFLKYFPGCSIVRIFCPHRTFILDIRTASISKYKLVRDLLDFVLRCESKLFKYITIISESLAHKLIMPINKVHVLPLGADIIKTKPKIFDNLDLLYVGTFSGRKLEKTIIGFDKFYRENKNEISMSYTLIGDGYRGERNNLQSLVTELGLENVIKLPGFIHHEGLGTYWEKSNVGVSFVPINIIYDAQPPTKTFEYILAGMVVIATNTTENRRVINKINGVLIKDTANDFYLGLKEIYDNRTKYNADSIRQTCVNYQWDNIVKKYLCTYLKAMLTNSNQQSYNK